MSGRSRSEGHKLDAIVVGAGHNGLICANYLARGGLDVLVLERNSYIGGAAVSRELYPQFTYSNCSYVCSLLRPEIMRTLELPRHGLQIIPYEGGCTMMRDGNHLALYDNHDALRREIGIPNTLAEVGVPADEIAKVAQMAAADPSAVTNPIAFTAADYAAILEAALSGELP